MRDTYGCLLQHPADLGPLIQDELALLADVEARYEADLDRVVPSAKRHLARSLDDVCGIFEVVE